MSPYPPDASLPLATAFACLDDAWRGHRRLFGCPDGSHQWRGPVDAESGCPYSALTFRTLASERIRLSVWARREGISRVTAYRMAKRGILPVEAEQSPTGRWYVRVHSARGGRSAIYARAAPGRNQVDALNRQIAAITRWASTRHNPVFAIVSEVADPVVGVMPRLARLLADEEIGEILIHNPDVLGFGRMQLLVAALGPQGRVIRAISRRPLPDDRVNEVSSAISALSDARGSGRGDARWR